MGCGSDRKQSTSIAIVLGAGASRGVSYERTSEMKSPLDRDFFDLLQRLDPQPDDKESVAKTLRWARGLPQEYWRSMERTFYTLHLNAYLRGKFGLFVVDDEDVPSDDEEFVHSFVNATGSLLRAAHVKKTCEFHKKLFEHLNSHDVVISFNYDLVIERALKAVSRFSSVPFGGWLYGFQPAPSKWCGPLVLKMHGSFNWEMPEERSGKFTVHTQGWPDLERAPGFRRFKRNGTKYPIFLPFWDKRIESSPWIDIWNGAFESLSKADSVVVWGYSLPATDVKAQVAFQLALGDHSFNLCVVNPSMDARDRWRMLFPDARFWEFERIDQFMDRAPSWWLEHMD